MNTDNVFSAQELKIFESLDEINKNVKALEKEKKRYSEKVKELMLSKNVDSIEHNGAKFTVTKSERHVVKSSSEFVTKLISMGKKSLVRYEIVPDVESILAEVNVGTLDKNFVDEYIKVTPIATLRCT